MNEQLLTNSVKAILFDMGNTLLDFHKGISDDQKDRLGAESVAEYLTKISKKQVTTDMVWSEFLTPWFDCMPLRKSRPEEFNPQPFVENLTLKLDMVLNQEQFVEVMKLCDVAYQKHLIVLPGAVSLLKSLKGLGYTIGVVSNSPQLDEVNIEHFKSTELYQYIDQYTFSLGAKCRKPSADIFHCAAEKLKCFPSECLMIGDSFDADISGAKSAGMEAIWVSPNSETETLCDLLKRLEN